MKRTLLQFGMIAVLLMGNLAAKSQLLLEENFNYTSGTPLVEGAVPSSDNSATSKTGWLTISNTTSAGTNSFNVSTAGLTYTGYPASGIGKAIDILDNGGQDVFKTFSSSNTNPTPGAPFPGPKTIYLAFMIKIPTGDKDGAEYFLGIKYSNSAGDNNYFGRIFAKVSGNNVQFGVSKSATPTNSWTGDYPIDKTYLIVLKYIMGGLNGANSTEETNKYDDKIDLYINPALGGSEPATATLHYENAVEKDAYRYSTSNSLIGGLAAVYLRTPSTSGAIPAATIDGIRVADTWAKLLSPSTGVGSINKSESVQMFVDQSHRKLNVDTKSAEFSQLEIFSVTGTKILEEKISQSNFDVELNSLKNGIYVVRLKNSKASFSSKIILN